MCWMGLGQNTRLLLLRYLLPTTDVLKYGCGTLIQVLADRFPALNEKIHQTNLDAIPIITMMSDEVIG